MGSWPARRSSSASSRATGPKGAGGAPVGLKEEGNLGALSILPKSILRWIAGSQSAILSPGGRLARVAGILAILANLLFWLFWLLWLFRLFWLFPLFSLHSIHPRERLVARGRAWVGERLR